MSETKQDITHLRQRLAQSTIIVDATRRFTSTLDSDEIQLALFEAAFQIVGAQQIALHLSNEQGLQSTVCHPMEGLRIETAVLPPEATAFHICEEVEPVIWNRDDDQAAPPISVDAIAQFDSYLAMPLKGADKIVGVIEAFNLLEPQNAAQQADLLAEIAGPAGLAIYNGTLYQESQREIAERKRIELEIRQKERELAKHAAQLETVSRVSTYTSTILEPEKLLQEVVNLTKDQFELYHVHIYLVNEAGDQLDLVVGAGDVGQQMVAQGRSIPLLQKQSLVAQVARSGQGLIENDVLNNPAFLPHPLLPDTRSETAVPVILRGRVVGVLDVQSDRVDMFTEQDVQIQTMLAAHIAVAMETARSYEQTRTSLAETEALLDITKETSHVLELTSIMDNVLNKVLTATNFDAGLITIVDPNTQKLEVKSHRLPDQFWNMLQENGLDGTLCDLVYRRRENVVVVDMVSDAPVDVTGLLGLGYKSYQGVPLESQGEVLGTLCLFSRQSLTSEKANTVFLQAVGRQIGIAIRNVALLEQSQTALSEAQQSRQSVQEYLDMQRLLHEINIELFRIDDLDELYRSAVELAHTRLGFERVGMYLLNESNDLLLGTYGVDAAGNICNERGPEYTIDQKDTIDTFVLNRTRLVVDEDIDLWYAQEIVGRGWHIGAAMWTEDSPIGVIFADNLITGQPLKPYQSELLFAYASIVSNLIQRNRFETIITKRAAEMQAVAEVGTAAATILDTDKLLQEVVDLTKNSFGLYHAHIYLLNKETQTLVLTSGAGTVGRQMVTEGRRIPLQQEQSLVARAARSRQGVIINDVQAEPGFLPHPLLPDTRAEMAVPLNTGQQVLGVLDVQSDRLNYFTKEDISTFTTLAAQMAVALQNANLFTQSAERAKELALINQVVTQMTTIQDVNASMQFLVEELGAATQASSSVINFINANRTAQEVVAAYLQEGMPNPVGTVMPIEGDPLLAQILESRKTLVVDDVASAPFPPEIRDLILQSGFRSLYVIPMFTGRDLIGSATLSVLQGGEPLTREQIRLAETLVFQATSVVQSIRLYAQTEERAKELAFVNRIVTEINVLDTETGPQFLAEELGKILQVPLVNIRLIDDTGTMLEVVAAHHPAEFPSPVGTVFPIGEMQTRQTIIIEDIANSNLPPRVQKGLLEAGIRSLYIIPMVVGRDLIGSVAINILEGGSLLTPDQLKLAETTVYQAATAVQHARLFTQSEERETLMRTIIDSTPDWIFVKDVDHRYLMVNQGYANVFHTTPDEFIGKNDLDMGFPEELVKGDPDKGIRGFWADDREIMDSGQMKVFDVDPATVDGEVHLFNTIKVPLRDAAGYVTGVVGFARDITDRLRIEETLRQNEARLAESAHIAQLGHWEFDVQTQIFTFTDQLYALLRTSAEQEGGYQMSAQDYAQKFVHPDDADMVGLAIQKALEATDPNFRMELEHRIIRTDGTEGYVLIRFGIEKDAQGQTVKTVGANQDITERKLIEDALAKQARELQIVSELSTTVATMLEQEKLLQEVVDLTKERFNFYHAQIYLLNAQQDSLVLAFGAGDAGRELVAQKHRIGLNAPQSLVAQAARSGQAVVVNDVRENPDWLPNELLPQTQAEMTVPMMVGDRVVGVLDVQSESVNRFTDQDMQIQTTLAAQVSIALENARSFEQAQKAVANLNDVTRRLTREGWQDYLGDLPSGEIGFIYDPLELEPIRSMAQAQGDEALEDTVRNGDIAREQSLMRAITVHGESIGQFAFVPDDADKGFDEEAAEIIAAVTEQLSARIENLRLTDQTQIALAEAERQSKELALINRVVTEISSSFDLQESLQIVATELAKAISVEQVGITLLNDARTEATVVAEYFGESKFERALGVVFTLEGNQLTQQVINTRQPVVVTDAQRHPLTAPIHDVMRARGTQTLAILPMVAGNEVIGTVGIDVLDKDRVLNEDELRLAETIIFQAATAVHNTRLFDQTETALAETEVLYKASAELNTAGSYEEILAVLCQHTLIGDGAQNVSLNYFDHPWTNTQRPTWIDVLARISELPEDAVSSRYLLAQFPSAETLLHTNETVPIEDIPNDPRIGDAARALYVQRFKAKSTIVVPLLAGNQQIGYINAIYQHPTTFPDVKQRRLMVLTRQAAVAIQSLHSFTLAEQRSADLATLNEMGRALTMSLDIDDILETVHQYTARLMNTDDLYVALYDRELDEIDVKVFGEGEQTQTGMRRRGGNGITEYIIRSRRPLLMNEDFEEMADRLGFEVFGRTALSWLGVPITVGDNVLGVIAVQSFETPNLYDDSHQDLLTALASQVAIAIENVNLFGQVQARARREQLLREITENVRGAADIETIMRVAVQEVGRVLGRNTYIQLKQDEEAPTAPPGNGAGHE